MLRDESMRVEASWCGVDSEGGHEERCANLHRALKRIVKARGSLDIEEAAALREAQRLRVWRHYGYSSLIEYMEMEIGYSPRAALERLRVAKAIVELPVIADAMSQGELSFSAARELTRVATPETEQEWLEAANDKNLRQIEDLVSGHKRGERPTDPPDPALRKRRLRFDDLAPETVALMRQARAILDRELGERLDDDAFLRTIARAVIDGAGAVPRSRAPYQIAVVTCEQCKRAWQDGGGITVEMSPAAAATALCDAQHIGSVDEAPGRGRAAQLPAASSENAGDSDSRTPTPLSARRARTSIPPALRRKVTARDHARCRVPWCRSSRNIDQHHLKPVAEGGEHTLDNLITLCESHHLAHHDGALLIEGDAMNASFTRRAHAGFANAQHAVDTAKALRSLGFDKHEAKTAVDKARTHVGTAALTLEQWIKVALTYCPKPRG